MKNLLAFILKHLVSKEEDIVIDETETTPGQIVYKIKVNTKDMGKVIGKSGKTINAIRDCLKILAVKKNLFVDLVLNE